MIYDKLENAYLYESLGEKFKKAFDFLKTVNAETEVGKHVIDGDDIFCNVMDTSTNEGDGKFEFHKAYIDVQMDIVGKEIIEVENIHNTTVIDEYDATKDAGFSKADSYTRVAMNERDICILFPEDTHRPNVKVGEIAPLKKAVVKIRV
jgi:YhcH/YjgK/YiaL family protein